MAQHIFSKRFTFLLPLFAIIALLAIIASLFIGSYQISANEIFQAFSGSAQPVTQTLIFELRLPRALAAFACGAMLSIAGVLMQVLLRNPLADPYVLGVSGGAALAALLVMLMGLDVFFITSGAFAGALLSIFLVFIFAHGKGGWTVTRLLLTGIVMASGWGAIISFVLVIAPPDKVHGMLFWLMGDLSYDRPLLPGYLILVTGFILTLPLCRHLNVMIWGEHQAGSLGVNVSRLRLSIFFISSLLTAGAVSLAGGIGFVGLVVPHFVRLIVGNDHRILVPISALAGGTLVVLADTVARSLMAPQQIPVGVITALLGVPLFLYLLRRSQ